jgi:hypothetical protein
MDQHTHSPTHQHSHTHTHTHTHTHIYIYIYIGIEVLVNFRKNSVLRNKTTHTRALRSLLPLYLGLKNKPTQQPARNGRAIFRVFE